MNIYKRSGAQMGWEKLNGVPLVLGQTVPSNHELTADSNLQKYINIVKDMKPEEMKGIGKVMIIVKAIQSPAFARYIGVQFDDRNVIKGIKYQYKITEITGAGELEIGYSKSITADAYIPTAPPDSIVIISKDKKVNINWKPEPERFYAINIYRTKAAGKEFKRLNDVPFMISERRGPDGVMSLPDVFFTDDSVKNHKTYSYKLAAIDYFGREGMLSKEFIVAPKDATPPPAPGYLQAKVDNRKVKLT